MHFVYLGYIRESEEKKYKVIEDSESEEEHFDKSNDTSNVDVSQGEIKM